MGNGNSIINLGALSKPATVLIEKISDAIGGIFKPYQIRRVAQAEAEAKKIKASAEIEITQLQQRALIRFVAEEAKKQDNIESITQKALNQLNKDSKPQDMEDDWISNFFDKCRLISDEEMQSLWAKVLAGEANSPGNYSKRTVNFLSSIDKSDAMLFTNLCAFGWFVGNVVPLIYDVENEIYTKRRISFSTLKHLDEIGLITFDNIAGFVRRGFPKITKVFYYGTPINIAFKDEKDNVLKLGKVLLSKTGQELAPISGSEPIPEFINFVLEHWTKMGYATYSDFPGQQSKSNE
jgi:hypothetical protein